MPTISAWGGGEAQPEAIADVISYKSVSTGTITRGSSTATAQTVRLETLGSSRQVQGENGQTYTIDALALGYKGHATISDTDLRVGDRFTVSGQMFEVEMVMPGHTDNLQAYLRLRR